MSEHKRPHQPSPIGSLMISAVALARTAAIMPLVSAFILSEAAKAMRREQAARAHIDDSLLLLRRKRALWKRHCKNLIRAKRRVVANTRIIDHVVAAVGA